MTFFRQWNTNKDILKNVSVVFVLTMEINGL